MNKEIEDLQIENKFLKSFVKDRKKVDIVTKSREIKLSDVQAEAFKVRREMDNLLQDTKNTDDHSKTIQLNEELMGLEDILDSLGNPKPKSVIFSKETPTTLNEERSFIYRNGKFWKK